MKGRKGLRKQVRKERYKYKRKSLIKSSLLNAFHCLSCPLSFLPSFLPSFSQENLSPQESCQCEKYISTLGQIDAPKKSFISLVYRTLIPTTMKYGQNYYPDVEELVDMGKTRSKLKIIQLIVFKCNHFGCVSCIQTQYTIGGHSSVSKTCCQ